MNILIGGGTGFIGKNLTKLLNKDGNKIIVITRKIKNKTSDSNIKYVTWENLKNENLEIDCCINLTGEPIFGYWNSSLKKSK
jgi:uncharacterized protein